MSSPQVPPVTGPEWMRLIERRLGSLERRNPGMTSVGAVGPGVPAGGHAGDILTKTSTVDYATAWGPLPGGSTPRYKGTADNAGQSIADGVVVPVPLVVETWDSHNGHSAALPTRYTAPTAGIYAVHGNIYFGPNASANRIGVMIGFNGTPVPSSRTQVTTAGADQLLGCYDEIVCAVGDYLELMVFHKQSTGTAAITIGGPGWGSAVAMTARWVSPP